MASEILDVKPTQRCAQNQPCGPKIVVNEPVARVVEVLLITCIAAVIAIIHLNQMR
ncbi:hypothetical protein LTR66_013397, partial [Elasticomyces elasticus]